MKNSGTKYKKLDVVTKKLEMELEIGKFYILGIAHLGYLFSHYLKCKVISKTIHNEYSISYGVISEDNKSGYLWDQPRSRGMTRIVSAKLL